MREDVFVNCLLKTLVQCSWNSMDDDDIDISFLLDKSQNLVLEPLN